MPTRALVQQQARYIKRHSDVQGCTVAELCGMEMEGWDLNKWEECKRNNKVCSCLKLIVSEALSY